MRSRRWKDFLGVALVVVREEFGYQVSDDVCVCVCVCVMGYKVNIPVSVFT